MSASPSARAPSRYRIWPTCRMSKQPFAKTIFFACVRNSSATPFSCSRSTIFSWARPILKQRCRILLRELPPAALLSSPLLSLVSSPPVHQRYSQCVPRQKASRHKPARGYKRLALYPLPRLRPQPDRFRAQEDALLPYAHFQRAPCHLFLALPATIATPSSLASPALVFPILRYFARSSCGEGFPVRPRWASRR